MALEYGMKVRCVDAKHSRFENQKGQLTVLVEGDIYTVEHEYQNVDKNYGNIQLVEREGIVYDRARFEQVV